MGNTTTLSLLNQLAFNAYVGQWLVFAFFLPVWLMLAITIWQNGGKPSSNAANNNGGWRVMVVILSVGLVVWPFFSLLPWTVACYYLVCAMAVAAYHCRYKALVKMVRSAGAALLGAGILLLIWIWGG